MNQQIGGRVIPSSHTKPACCTILCSRTWSMLITQKRSQRDYSVPVQSKYVHAKKRFLSCFTKIVTLLCHHNHNHQSSFWWNNAPSERQSLHSATVDGAAGRISHRTSNNSSVSVQSRFAFSTCWAASEIRQSPTGPRVLPN